MNVPLLERLIAVSALAAFNNWASFEVAYAEPGRCGLEMRWRPEFGQYAGYLHAGLVAALLDTSCGFAAATIAGQLVTSQMSLCFVAPAVGRSFRADGALVRAGRRQVFSEARLYARSEAETLVATASAVLLRQPEHLEA